MTWFEILPAEVVALGQQLAKRADAERAAGKVIYPAQEDIFRALELTPPERLKLVICGQVILSAVGMGNVGTL